MNNENNQIRSDYEKLKCIWMASQVIEYKLCDNSFDCENCRFDKVMRNLFDESKTQNDDIMSSASIILQKLNSIRYDDQIIYLKNNLIVKEICKNTFYLGINPIFISILDSVDSLKITDCKKIISAGQEVFRVNGEWGTISITAPMNFLIHDIPEDNANAPLRSQWFSIIGADENEISKAILDKKAWMNLHQFAINAVEDIKSHIPQVGSTMMDGGTQIRFLHQLVGKNRYIKILNSLNSF